MNFADKLKEVVSVLTSIFSFRHRYDMKFRRWLETNTGIDLTNLNNIAQYIRNHYVSGRSRYGDCELVADEFLCGAREAGLAGKDDSYIVWGWRMYDPIMYGKPIENKPPGQHQWVVIRGTLYDLSADQFGDQPIVITSEHDPRYKEHTKMSHTFRKSGALRQ